jgi:teichuronic acid biosynthesis glycosyltransferase TuaC
MSESRLLISANVSPAPSPKSILRVLMVQVGNPLSRREEDPSAMEMNSLSDDGPRWFRAKDIINATSQMRSLADCNVAVFYGFLYGRKSLWKLCRAGFKIRKMVQQEKIQLVHVLWGTTTSAMVILFSPVPVIISFCGSDLFGVVDAAGQRLLRGRLSRLLSQLSALGAAKVVVKSRALKQVLWECIYPKTIILPNGVDSTVFYPITRDTARSSLGWSPAEKILLFFTGGGAIVKNRQLAESVFVLVQKMVPEAKFCCVDNVPHEVLVYYYNAADVMLLTSHHEGSNNSLKEALCCNLPVVSVDCGDAIERLEGVRNCSVHRNRDPASMAREVVSILQRATRSNGCEHMKNLEIRVIASRLRVIYEDTLNPL